MFATPSYTLNTVLKTASYDALRDFAPVGLIGTGSYTLVVHPSVPAKSFAELIALAKAQPGKLNCASAGIGTAPQIACEAFNKIPGVNIVHVPYRNVNEAISGVVGNHVQMFVAVSLVAQPADAVERGARAGDHRRQTVAIAAGAADHRGVRAIRTSCSEAGTASSRRCARRSRCWKKSTAKSCVGLNNQRCASG